MLDVEAAAIGQRRGQAYFGHNFAGGQGSATGAEERLGQGQPAFPAGAGNAAPGIVGQQGGQGIAGGGCVADVAGHGGQVAYLDAGESGSAGRQSGVTPPDHRMLLNVLDGGQGANGKAVVIVPGYVVEPAQVPDADHGVRLPGAGAPADEKVGAAGDQAGAVAVFGEHSQGFVQRMRLQVVKTRHQALLNPAAGHGREWQRGGGGR